MSTLSKLSGDDHPVSFVAGAVAAVVGFVVFGLAWYYALILAMIVSGLLEFGIKEVPPDTDDYDAEQYELWDAASEESPAETGGEQGDADEIVRLQQRYTAGEIDEAQFERELEQIMGSDQSVTAADGLDERETLRESDR